MYLPGSPAHILCYDDYLTWTRLNLELAKIVRTKCSLWPYSINSIMLHHGIYIVNVYVVLETILGQIRCCLIYQVQLAFSVSCGFGTSHCYMLSEKVHLEIFSSTDHNI